MACAMIAGIALFAPLGCKRAVEERPKTFAVGIDLTTLTPQGAAAPGVAPATESPKARSLVLQPKKPLDLFFRVPRDATLVFSQPVDADPEAIAIDVESPKASASLSSRSGRNGQTSASLKQFAEQRVRLRLENLSADPLTIERPRVIGADVALPPILEPPPKPADARLNVVLFVVDTLRADRLSAYGYQRKTSPRIEELAGRGVLFERSYSVGSSTWPSTKALFASRFPSDLGEYGLASEAVVPKTLAEAFRDAGYATASFNGNFSLIHELGFARGFEKYELLRRDAPDGPPEVSGDVIYDRALDWVRAHRDQPFFLWLQTMDVHGYVAPAEWRGRFDVAAPPAPGKPAAAPEEAVKVLEKLSPQQIEALDALANLSREQLRRLERFDQLSKLSPESREKLGRMAKLSPEERSNFQRFHPDRYDEAVAYTDHLFGRFVDALGELGLADRTIVVLTADHGEPLGQHGQIFHGTSLHEELVHVPLVMLFPRARAERVKSIVSAMDLGPTLVEMVGLPVPDRFAGRSLLRPRSHQRPPSAFGEQPPFAWGPKVEGRPYLWFAREGRWKLLMDPNRIALYDLSTDPGESKDVSAGHPIETGYLVGALTQRVPLLRGVPTPSTARLRSEARRKLDAALRALGYVE